jgi:hypothetical protein
MRARRVVGDHVENARSDRVMAVLLPGDVDRKSSRASPTRTAVPACPSGVGRLAPTGAASTTTGRSTRRAWPRAKRDRLTGRERRCTRRTRPGRQQHDDKPAAIALAATTHPTAHSTTLRLVMRRLRFLRLAADLLARSGWSLRGSGSSPDVTDSSGTGSSIGGIRFTPNTGRRPSKRGATMGRRGTGADGAQFICRWVTNGGA